MGGGIPLFVRYAARWSAHLAWEDLLSNMRRRPTTVTTDGDRPTEGAPRARARSSEVCRQLEGLLRQTAATQRHSVERLGRVLRLSRELALAAVGVALRALSQQPREGCAEGVPPELPVERLAEAAGGAGGCDAEPGAAPEEGARSFDFGTEAARAPRHTARRAHGARAQSALPCLRSP